MTPLVILLLAMSLGVLLAGTYLWRITGSRSIFLNTMFATTCMMLAAYHVVGQRGLEWAVTLPFFASMLFGGRAIGTGWRSRKEAQLRLPAQLMAGIAFMTLTASIAVYTSFQF
jgi:hypothetical protein